MNIENDIQVSVCVVTYNQEKYIAECIESLVTQQTSFKFEIIVGEDCSTDATREIVQRYVEKYPDLIFPLFYKENVGPVENIKQVYKKAKGKYIAHIDGDDMALPGKLQKQFEVLEQNAEFSICSHNVFAVSEKGEVINNFWLHKEGVYNFEAYLKEMPFFVHSSKFFLKEHLDVFLVNMGNNTFDFEIHFLSIKKGSVFHLNEKLGMYRLNVGVTKNNRIKYHIYKSKINIYEQAFDFFTDKYFLKKIYIKECLKLLKFFIKNFYFSEILLTIKKINKVLFLK